MLVAHGMCEATTRLWLVLVVVLPCNRLQWHMDRSFKFWWRKIPLGWRLRHRATLTTNNHRHRHRRHRLPTTDYWRPTIDY
ncbi:hypothetical protein C8T65DRAFT_640051 [Cerioporus squamosus]|nr:hypothetical protein C8T65DRAFT_640051 [Cerioporus squamosus]